MIEIKTTNTIKDNCQLIKELKKDKKKFNSYFKSCLDLYLLPLCWLFLIPCYLKILSCLTIKYIYPSVLEIIIIDITIVLIYFICIYKSSLILGIVNKFITISNLSITDDKCIIFKAPINKNSFRSTTIDRFYKTENYFVLKIQNSGIWIIKKSDLSIDIKEKLIETIEHCIKQNEVKNKTFINRNLSLLICLFAIIVSIIFSPTILPVEKDAINKIEISEDNVINILENSSYWQKGLRTNDVIVSIGDEKVYDKDPKEVEKMLKNKNIEITVFKLDTHKYKKYTLK